MIVLPTFMHFAQWDLMANVPAFSPGGKNKYLKPPTSSSKDQQPQQQQQQQEQ